MSSSSHGGRCLETYSLSWANHAPPAMVSLKAKETVMKMIAEAKGQGVSVLDGDWSGIAGSYNLDSGDEQNAFKRLIVLKYTATEIKVWTDEIFGLAVVMTTVEGEEEAIEIADSSEYGLAASIFTEDPRRGFRVAKSL